MLPQRAFVISGLAFVFIGFIILLNSFQTITAFVILEDIDDKIGYFAGIWFVVVGILLLNASRTIYEELGDIVNGYNHGKVNPIRAAIETRNALRRIGREINGVRYRGSEQGVTVKTAQGAYSLRAENRERAAELALGIYEIALSNNPQNDRNCELHLSKRASTKDHRKGFLQEEEKFRRRYSTDVNSLGR